MAVKGLVGDPLAMAFISAAIGGGLWWHEHHFQRLTAWMFAVTGWCLALAIPPWQAALAGLAQTGPGLLGLLVVTVFLGIAFWLQAVRNHKQSRLRRLAARIPGVGSKELALVGDAPPRPPRYHHVRTPVIGLCAGTLALVLVGSWRLILASGTKAVAGTGKALITSQQQISSGHAAQQVPAHSRPEILLIGLAAVVVLYLFMRARHRRRSGVSGRRGGPVRGGGGMAALPGGRG